MIVFSGTTESYQPGGFNGTGSDIRGGAASMPQGPIRKNSA